MIIRDATADDMPDLLRMGEAFYETTYYAKIAPFDNDTVENLMNIILDTGVLKLAVVEGVACGMIGLVMFPFAFNAKVVSAHEVFWYISPDERMLGFATRLFESAEQECLSKGAVSIQMASLVTSPEGVKKFYESLGYKLEESFYVKVV
jgi:GNAT superfamily N-acetyltransferase